MKSATRHRSKTTQPTPVRLARAWPWLRPKCRVRRARARLAHPAPSAESRLGARARRRARASHRFRPARFARRDPRAVRALRAQMSACSESACELTDTYSPAAIDIAPATSPETPAIRMFACDPAAAATPTIRLAVERMPSLAPSTAARSQPMRATRWLSGGRGVTGLNLFVGAGQRPWRGCGAGRL